MTADVWRFLAGATAVIVLAFAGLAWSGPSGVSGLRVRTDGGARIVDPADGRTLSEIHAQVSSPDQAVAYWTAWSTDGTELLADSVGTGERLWQRELPGRWEARLASDRGLVVLAEPGGDPYRPVPRDRTRLAVASREQAEPAVYDLAGNYEPEAVARDGSSVFVISFTPPHDPERYQVRRLDLRTGRVVDVYTPDAELQTEMGGTPRTQLASPDGRRLYTLYTDATADGHTTAFVHVLDLDELWAHCIVLPEGFATGNPSGTALALTPDGDRLYLADRASATLAEIDTARLEVTRATPTPAITGEPLLAVGRDWAAVGSGEQVRLLDLEDLTPTARWRTAGAELVGLAAGRDELYAATVFGIRVVAPDGSSSRELRLEGSVLIRGVGTTSTRVEQPDIVCAC